MNQIKNLVMIQLKDTVDLTWTKSAKDKIHVIGLSLIKFALLLAFNTAILYGLLNLNVIYYSNVPSLMTLIISFIVLALVISDTIGLTKSLYFSDDNKVLITLPVKNNQIFISKLLVFLVYEAKRSFEFIVPVILGCMINIYMKGYLSPWSFLWGIIPMLILIVLPVLLGALLSIPALYLYRLSYRYVWFKILLIGIGLTLYILFFLGITTILPEEISMIFDWPRIKNLIMHFIIDFDKYNWFVFNITHSMIGELNNQGFYAITWVTFVKFLILVAICGLLFILCYFISRPIFFNMMSKNFEFNRSKSKKNKNKSYNKLISLNIKEARLSFRSYEIAFNYLLTYITVPLVLFILDKLFMAMDKNEFGVYFAYAFNILFIIFPLLMANGLIATLYSKEGRVGYMNKTFPMHAYLPLLSKITFNFIFVIPCIISSTLIFSSFVNHCVLDKPDVYTALSSLDIVLLIVTLIVIYYGHLIFCVKLDVLNPLNEAYATSTTNFSNVNQNRATGVGIAIAIILFLLSFILFEEVMILKGPVTSVILKLLLIAVIISGYFVISFVLGIKTIYERNKD